jgi:hypothetical protein
MSSDTWSARPHGGKLERGPRPSIDSTQEPRWRMAAVSFNTLREREEMADERTTEEYSALFARSGLRLARAISLGDVPEAMGHHLIEAEPI